MKAIRGVASPNMGFACQLLQWQKRVLKSRPPLPKPLPNASSQDFSGPFLRSEEMDASRSSAASSGIAVPDLPYSGDSFSVPMSLAVVGRGSGGSDEAISSNSVDVAACRMYRIAPHSPYDAMHLVPKIANFGDTALDPRGAFLIQVRIQPPLISFMLRFFCCYFPSALCQLHSRQRPLAPSACVTGQL